MTVSGLATRELGFHLTHLPATKVTIAEGHVTVVVANDFDADHWRSTCGAEEGGLELRIFAVRSLLGGVA